jgi:hypothetical protein
MIKTRNADLKIYDTWSGHRQTVKEFVAPDAFIFLYEKEKFLTLKRGVIEIWTSEGVKVTDFGARELCSQVELASADQTGQSEANYIVSVSQSKRYLFAFQSLEKPG